jgi:hypothetical protein
MNLKMILLFIRYVLIYGENCTYVNSLVITYVPFAKRSQSRCIAAFEKADGRKPNSSP